MSAPGFGDAPVSKGMVVVTLVASIVGAIVRGSRLREAFGIDVGAIFSRREVWRLVTAQLMAPPPSELILSLILLYTFRLFERTNGSRKFAGSVLFLWLTTTALNVVFLLLFPALKFVSPGPYWLIFGLFIQFFVDIPPTTRFRLFNWPLPLSDKSFVYLLGLQLLFAGGTQSAMAGASGLLSGLLYRAVPAFGALRPPACLTRFCARFCAPLLGGSSPASAVRASAAAAGEAYAPVAQGPNNGEVPMALVGGGGGVGGGDAAAYGGAMGGAAAMPDADLVEPSEAAVAELQRLGFADEQRIRRVLAQSGNSVAIATDRLLSSP